MTERLPTHGRVQCAICHEGKTYGFDQTVTGDGDWRITNNPLAWGCSEPEVVVLGFSKGPTQAGALASAAHDQIAFKGGRTNLAKILHHLRLIERPDSTIVDQAISDRSGKFHFGSLVRCTVERQDARKGWTGTGGGMLDRFVETDFGRLVVTSCAKAHLSRLPARTRVVIMLGLGSNLGYVRAARAAIEQARPGRWRTLSEVAYADEQIVVVHTEHFQSQGALLPNWLSEDRHPRGRWGLMAREAVARAMAA